MELLEQRIVSLFKTLLENLDYEVFEVKGKKEKRGRCYFSMEELIESELALYEIGRKTKKEKFEKAKDELKSLLNSEEFRGQAIVNEKKNREDFKIKFLDDITFPEKYYSEKIELVLDRGHLRNYFKDDDKSNHNKLSDTDIKDYLRRFFKSIEEIDKLALDWAESTDDQEKNKIREKIMYKITEGILRKDYEIGDYFYLSYFPGLPVATETLLKEIKKILCTDKELNQELEVEDKEKIEKMKWNSDSDEKTKKTKEKLEKSFDIRLKQRKKRIFNPEVKDSFMLYLRYMLDKKKNEEKKKEKEAFEKQGITNYKKPKKSGKQRENEKQEDSKLKVIFFTNLIADEKRFNRSSRERKDKKRLDNYVPAAAVIRRGSRERKDEKRLDAIINFLYVQEIKKEQRKGNVKVAKKLNVFKAFFTHTVVSLIEKDKQRKKEGEDTSFIELSLKKDLKFLKVFNKNYLALLKGKEASFYDCMKKVVERPVEMERLNEKLKSVGNKKSDYECFSKIPKVKLVYINNLEEPPSVDDSTIRRYGIEYQDKLLGLPEFEEVREN